MLSLLLKALYTIPSERQLIGQLDINWYSALQRGVGELSIPRDFSEAARARAVDEMVVRISDERMYLWRAVDHEGEVLDRLCQVYILGTRNGCIWYADLQGFRPLMPTLFLASVV